MMSQTELENKIVKVHDKTFQLLLSEEKLKERVIELGKVIETKYRDKKPVLLALLNGAFIFAADLIRELDFDCELGFVRVESYQGMKSTGKLNIPLGPELLNLEGRHVILIEDIVDSGNTLNQFLPVLNRQKPASVAIAAMLVKPDAMEHKLTIDFTGFEIANLFVVGYGLDYDGLGRNLPALYQLKEEH